MTRISAIILALVASFGAAKVQGASCTVSATGVAFGAYNRLNPAPLDVVGNVAATCTGASTLLGGTENVSYTIGLSPGSASYSSRQMAGLSGNKLNYNLYADPPHAIVWGNGSSGTVTVGGQFLNLRIGSVLRRPETRSSNHPVYGRISAGQNVPAGSYSDTITVTVTY